MKNKKNKNCGVVLGNSTILVKVRVMIHVQYQVFSREILIYIFIILCGRGFSGYQEIMNLKLFQHKKSKTLKKS